MGGVTPLIILVRLLINVKVSRSDHHAGRFQGVVAEPELPDDPSVVTVVRVVREVFTIQVCFETAVRSKVDNVAGLKLVFTCRTTTHPRMQGHMDST